MLVEAGTTCRLLLLWGPCCSSNKGMEKIKETRRHSSKSMQPALTPRHLEPYLSLDLEMQVREHLARTEVGSSVPIRQIRLPYNSTRCR